MVLSKSTGPCAILGLGRFSEDNGWAGGQASEQHVHTTRGAGKNKHVRETEMFVITTPCVETKAIDTVTKMVVS